MIVRYVCWFVRPQHWQLLSVVDTDGEAKLVCEQHNGADLIWIENGETATALSMDSSGEYEVRAMEVTR